MSENFKTFLTFALGAAAGSAVTWYFVTKKHIHEFEEWAEEFQNDLYRGLSADAEEESEYYEEEESEETPIRVAAERPHSNPRPIQEYYNPNKIEPVSEEGDESMDEPYVITPEQFSELDYEGYATETLTLYADGVLTDYLDNVIENVDDVVGEDSLNHFGEYEEDTVFVRNDHLMTGYEIQRDNRTYAEVVGE